MIYVNRPFRTVVEKEGNISTRLCTGAVLAAMNPDDILQDSIDEDSMFPVKNFEELRKRGTVGFLLMALLALSLFGGMCWELYQVWLMCLELGKIRFSSDLVFCGLYCTGFILYFRSVVNPIMFDSAGHWVNLRTGDSNLCGGINMKRKDKQTNDKA